MSGGKQVRLFLVEGDPGGLLTAEIMNWTGHVLAGPRSEIGGLLRREEAHRTGVYVLLGTDPTTGGPAAYIGEGDDVGARLRMHARPESAGGKDFWDRVAVVTSKDANLTKAHARYLESRLIDLAAQAKRCTLANGTAPPPIQLPEADVSDMEYFIGQAMIVFPVLGVSVFRAPVATHAQPVQTVREARELRESPVFVLTVPRHHVEARAQEIGGEFTVLEGSLARDKWVGTDRHPGYQAAHARLLAEGALEPDGQGLARFTRNTVFDSPSAAGAVVTGRACNGRTSWISRDEKVSYGEWQSRGIDAAGPEDNAVGL